MTQETLSTVREQDAEGQARMPFYNVRAELPPPAATETLAAAGTATPPASTATPQPASATLAIEGTEQIKLLVRSAVNEALDARATAKPPAIAAGVHTSRRTEPQGFSILRVIGSMVGKYNKRSAAYELDILSKYGQALIELGWKPAGEHVGFAFPIAEALNDEAIRPLAIEIRSAMQSYTSGVDPDELFRLRSQLPTWYTRDLSPLIDTAGGSLIPLAAQGDFIELLRAKARVIQAGARVVPMPPNGAARYPRQATAGTAYRVGVGATITESTPGTGWVTLSAKKVAAFYDMPNEFFRFASPGIETFVRQDLTQVLALKIDQDCLEGAADSVGIKGILLYDLSAADTVTVAKVQLIAATTTAANGDTVAYADGDKMLTALEEVNANSETAAFIMRPTKRRNIFARRADAVTAADAAGPFLGIPTIGERPRTWYGQPVLVTTQITNNRVKGTGSNLTYVVCADWSDYLLALMGVAEITWNPYDSTLFTQDATRIRAIQQCDGAPRHLDSFALMDNLLPTT